MLTNSSLTPAKKGRPQGFSWTKLSYSQKFAIITLIFTLSLLAFVPLAYEQVVRIDRYGYKEADGNLYLRSLWELTGSLQNYYNQDAKLQNGEVTQQEVEVSKDQVTADIQTLSAVESATGTLADPITASELSGIWNESQSTNNIFPLLERVSEATLNVGDESFLILDPDLDTYYLMDSVLLKLPENRDLAFKIKLLSDQAAKNNELNIAEENELRNHINATAGNLNNIERGLAVASEDNTNQVVSSTTIAAFNKYLDSANAYTEAIQQALIEGTFSENTQELDRLYTQANIAESDFYSSASEALERGIQNRIRILMSRLVTYVLVSVFGIVIAFIIGNQLVKSISEPLSRTIAAAEQLASGNVTVRITNLSDDEAGKVMQAFNRLAEEVEANQNIMKQRSDDLTDKTLKLETIAKVARQITSLRDLSSVLSTSTNLIHENFGYYHVGIFLLDERKEYALLAATNSEGGRKMIEENYQLKVGETGIVGHVAESLQARIALDVGKDAVFFNNPYLPETRSELALPLVVSGQILGVLDVQSTKPGAFNSEDTAILQILAEQLAVAIQNANLFSEKERALEASRVTYGQLSREAWSKILRNQARVGFIATPPATVQTQPQSIEPSISKAIETGDLILGSDGLTISVPVKIRGQVIGAIRLKKSEIAEAWTQDETNLAIALADQLSGAMESARLYRESQQRAAREALVSDISARMNATSNMEAILRETVQELGAVIGNASVTFHLLNDTNGQKQVEGLQ